MLNSTDVEVLLGVSYEVIRVICVMLDGNDEADTREFINLSRIIYRKLGVSSYNLLDITTDLDKAMIIYYANKILLFNRVDKNDFVGLITKKYDDNIVNMYKSGNIIINIGNV